MSNTAPSPYASLKRGFYRRQPFPRFT